MTTKEKNAMISLMILEHRANGLTVREAIDAVFGEGAYKKIAGIIYDELRKANTPT